MLRSAAEHPRGLNSPGQPKYKAALVGHRHLAMAGSALPCRHMSGLPCPARVGCEVKTCATTCRALPCRALPCRAVPSEPTPSPAGLDLTFHRAFDLVKDQRKALDDLVACRVKRVLSSGEPPQAQARPLSHDRCRLHSHECRALYQSCALAAMKKRCCFASTAAPGCVPKAPSWSGYPWHAPCAAVGHGLPGPLLRQRAPLGPAASHAGGQQTVMEGLQQLAELVAQGGRRLRWPRAVGDSA